MSINSSSRRFQHRKVAKLAAELHISPRRTDSPGGVGSALKTQESRENHCRGREIREADHPESRKKSVTSALST